jgi:hypothetical protein
MAIVSLRSVALQMTTSLRMTARWRAPADAAKGYIVVTGYAMRERCKNMGSSRHGDRKTRYKIQSLRSLRDEMKAVARGSRPAPADAAKPSFDSVAAVIRLLTPENRRLLALIRDRKPQSVAELVR